MCFTIAAVPTLADDGTVADDNGADHRVRRRASPSILCEVERAAHECAIRGCRRALA
jgi:hypothetical protein